MDSSLLRNAIRAALLQRAGMRQDSRAIAEAAAAICRVLSVQLAPVVGRSGLDVLFKRVLLGAGTRGRTDLAPSAPYQDPGRRLSALPQWIDYLAGVPAAAAMEAGTEFLAAVAELLATFIGTRLTERLLAPVWGLPAPTTDEEKLP